MNRLFGSIVMLFGLVLTYNLFVGPKEAICQWLPRWLIFLGPVLIGVGALIWKGPSEARGRVASPGAAVLGIIFFLLGCAPWLYGAFVEVRQGAESATGMIGTITFILFGLPGLIFLVCGLRQRG